MIASQLGPVWHRAHRRQDRFAPAFGGGLCYVPASLDRGCARRPRQFQVGTGKRRFDRTEKLALGAGLDRPSEFNWQT